MATLSITLIVLLFIFLLDNYECKKNWYLLHYKYVSGATYESSGFVSSCGDTESFAAWFRGSN
jgi:hypothetical protein